MNYEQLRKRQFLAVLRPLERSSSSAIASSSVSKSSLMQNLPFACLFFNQSMSYECVVDIV